MDYAIYACDTGAAGRRFAWARVTSDRESGFVLSPNLDRLVDRIILDLKMSRAVALGFECPLSIPVPSHSGELSTPRPFDGDVPWCSPAAAVPALVGFQQALWILGRLREKVRFQFGTHWPPPAAGPALVCWEALLCGGARATCLEHPHERSEQCSGCAAMECRNAITAADAFLACLEGRLEPVRAEAGGALSMIGIAAVESRVVAPGSGVTSRAPMVVKPGTACSEVTRKCDPGCRRWCARSRWGAAA